MSFGLPHNETCRCALCLKVRATAVPVTQADRNVLAYVWETWRSTTDGEARKLRAGEDGNHGSPRWLMLQAIALSRISAEAASSADPPFHGKAAK